MKWAWILACLLSVCQSANFKGRILSNTVLPDVTLLSATETRVVIDGGQYVAFINKNAEFEFINIPDGTHILQVSSPSFQFDQIRLDIHKDSVQASLVLPGTLFKKKGPSMSLDLSARMKYDYFTAREGFNIIGMFSNPMMLMMLVSLGMMFILPKMTANLDPEELKELQSKQINPAQVDMPDVSQYLANWMAPKQPESPSKKRS